MSAAIDTRTEREQFLDDVLLIGIEGGINYWAVLDTYHWQNDDGTEGPVTAEIVDDSCARTLEITCKHCGEHVSDGRGIPEMLFHADVYYITNEERTFSDRVLSGEDASYQGPAPTHEHEPVTVTLNRDVIERAFARMAEGPVPYMSDKWRGSLLGSLAVLDPDYDAGDADAIIQVGLFGEVVYG